mmetsp:Transcript_15347/g.42451  ORF Transcript_15347/g.42451 Transcript_15347/m.42451 type:complete len:203 (+) Transcript_15347:1011-1619(+)
MFYLQVYSYIVCIDSVSWLSSEQKLNRDLSQLACSVLGSSNSKKPATWSIEPRRDPSMIMFAAIFSALSVPTARIRPRSVKRMESYTLLTAIMLCSTTLRSRIVRPSPMTAFWCACKVDSNLVSSALPMICCLYIFFKIVECVSRFSIVSSSESLLSLYICCTSMCEYLSEEMRMRGRVYEYVDARTWIGVKNKRRIIRTVK